MSGALQGGDVRGFYRALGVALPEWARPEASVSCFARPEAHARQDRDASCSVNVESGLWNCHGCGEGGGPYDAAKELGKTPREAMDLLIAYGLAERRAAGEAQPRRKPRAPARPAARPVSRPGEQVALGVGESDVARWGEQLVGVWPPRVLRAAQRSVWSRQALLELGCGWEHGRIMIPIRDRLGGLRGVLRYAPRHDHAPKMLAVPGTRLGLVPHPAASPGVWTVLVEGPPDMISARSRGLPAVAVPGDHAWEAEWAGLLAGRHVSVIMDCDRAGRDAAQRIAADLDAAGAVARVTDLVPGRVDGYDLTDWLADRRDLALAELADALGAPTSTEVA